jgi:glycosyltransferase involved in cell wall biosynthesis
MEKCYITIFTPTYNRAELLKRLYQSLQQQINKNFEWIIVDDASTDETEQMVSEWIDKEHKEFAIRYYKQPHGGKHRALNKGFDKAHGIYFFIVDSDDYLTEDATDKVEQWGKTVEARGDIAGVSGLRTFADGTVDVTSDAVDDTLWIECDNFERGKYNLLADMAEAYKTEIVRKYPFPEFEGEDFVTEAVCWNAVAADGYKLRWYRYPIYQCEYLEDGLTKQGANRIEGHIKNYRGYCYYVSQCIRVKPIIQAITTFREYNKTAKKMQLSLETRAQDLGLSQFQFWFMLFVKQPIVYFIRILYRFAHTR